jgi:hypothetical protein
MSGETEARPSGWTVDTLKEYVDRRLLDEHEHTKRLYETLKELKAHDFVAVRERFDVQTKASEALAEAGRTAINKAEAAVEKRLEALNELRSMVSDQQSTFIARVEADTKMAGNTKDIIMLSSRIDKIDGRGAGFQASWAIIVAIVMVALGGFGLYLSRPHMPEPVYQAAPPAYYPPPVK